MKEKDLIELVKKIISDSGDNPKRDGLHGTPERVAKLYKDLLSGYSMKIEGIVKNSLFSTTLDDMIVLKDIEFHSLCEHDLTPFFGTLNVAYIPAGKIIGLSKMHRVVNYFAKRPQVQERMTVQIFTELKKDGFSENSDSFTIICKN